MTWQPSMPIAPPWIVASEQKATTRAPSAVPVAARKPESSSWLSSSRDPSSKNAASLVLGLRGSLTRSTAGRLAAEAAAEASLGWRAIRRS